MTPDAPPVDVVASQALDVDVREAAAPAPEPARRGGWRDPVVLGLFAGGLVVLAGISLVLAWNVIYGPDEPSHRDMVEHQAHHVGPLSPELATWGGLRGHPYHLFSPLPYLPYVPFQWLQEAVGPVEGAGVPDAFVTRLGGLAFIAAQLAATAALARGLFRRISLRQAIVVAFAANLVPELRYVHAYVTADAMTILAGTIAFAVMVHVLARPRLGLREAALTGSALALVALVRYNALPIGGLLFVVFVVQVARRGGGLADRARAIGVALAIPLLLAGPLFLYVYDELDNGQLLLTGPVQTQLAESTYSGRLSPRPDDLLGNRVDLLPRNWTELWLDVVLYARLPDRARPAVVALCLVGLVGLALPTRRRRSPIVDLRRADAPPDIDLRRADAPPDIDLRRADATPDIDLRGDDATPDIDLAEPEPPGALSTQGRTVGWLAVGAVVLTYILMAAQWPFYPTGRYLVPAGIPALTALIAGCGALAGRLRIPHPVLLAAGGWGLGLLALDLWIMKVVITA